MATETGMRLVTFSASRNGAWSRSVARERSSAAMLDARIMPIDLEAAVG
jgi:hypothetical protein